MLDFQVQQYPFRLGLAEGQDPHQVAPGTLTRAENAVWRQGGRLEKRYGTAALAQSIIGGGSVSACVRMFTRGSELCLIDGTSLYVYSPTLTAWNNIGTVPEVGLTWEPLMDTAAGVAYIDQAISGSMRVTAWITGDARSGSAGSLFFKVDDIASGSVVKSTVAAGGTSTFTGIRVLILSGVIHILARNGANIYAFAYDLTTYASLAVQVLRSDSTTSGWDAMVIGSTIVLAYENTAPDLKLYAYTYAAGAYTQVATGGITGEAGSGHKNISIDGADGEVLYVCYSRNTADVRCRIATADSSTLAQITAPVDLEQSAVSDAGTYTDYRNVWVRRTSSTTAVAGWTTLSSTTQTGRAASIPASSTLTLSTTAKRGTWAAEWVTRPYILNSKLYAVLVDNTNGITGSYSNATTTCLVEVETSVYTAASTWVPHRCVGRIDVLIGGSFGLNYLPSALAVSPTEASFASPFQSVAAPTASSWRCGARQVSMTLGASLPVDQWRAFSAGGEAYWAAPVFVAYDGRIAFDYGIVRSAPMTYSAAGGGGVAAGLYLYGSAPEYRSNAGILHRGPTFAIPGTVTSAGSGTITLTIDSIALQSKQTSDNSGYASGGNSTPVRIALYRSVVGGTVLQRLTVDPSFAIVTDSALAFAQTYADVTADASVAGSLAGGGGLASRPAIYTAGGILDDYAPPGSVTMFHHADRLWVLAGDRYTWWYSKAFQDDAGVAPGFHPNFRVIFDTQQVAGATMDDKAIFFAADGVRYMQGLGPAPNGQNSDFSAPVAIQSDVGCNNARSVVGTPDGVMFGSDRGIYLLTRGLELVWIGRPVKDTLAAYPTITSAVLVPKQNQVRFTANNAAGDSSIVLVYDYVEKQWSTFFYWVTSSYGGLIADACMWNGTYTFVSAAGVVHTEDTTSYMDSGSYVPMTLETAWISANGPMSFASVRCFELAGESFTDHDLTITVGFDSDTSYQQTATWLGTSAVTAVGTEEPSVTIGTRRKCNTIRFKVVDATPTTGTVGTGRGPAWNMMALEVGLKRGLGNAPATKRA